MEMSKNFRTVLIIYVLRIKKNVWEIQVCTNIDIFQKRNSSASVTSSPARSTTNRLAVPNPPLRKRSGSAPSIKLITLASIWNLKHEHIRALKTTWARLCEPPRANCKGIVSLVERVWEKLDTVSWKWYECFLNYVSERQRCSEYFLQCSICWFNAWKVWTEVDISLTFLVILTACFIVYFACLLLFQRFSGIMS